MRTVSIFRNSRNQAIRIPKDLEYQGITELEIRRDGDTLILRPVRPSWTSFAELDRGEISDFLTDDRRDVIASEGRFDLGDDDLKPESGPDR
ncbi:MULTISPECIES: type II toxin-antitoxin system VapB family antitoxin [Burkholderia]|uniref:type II toxin-antitoxin system VapB family antitoxin n=1 Tax=Burkholderia TaxID=32008 RepID=UPI0006899F6E|nr:MULTISPECIES: type II toxin-antitoxin system VapB family antitoxin [Burkholderia]AYQ92683.1 AbrB/MazE/SpoVT family DNA-binding domain-containing protein [Burkholderia gladioli]NIE86696.1 AbrB/MazE/SpoVT family DNA-binding domain-containing protein [Burkholderia sp. Tr-860]NIF65789.1 AbrB/MazE/SpoVT family DNA-binding domain-containing protein [Burkholderia sp. Cy-647]NIF71274.1 AbrB/MazE/SpoVT family DNA-binding domain-containing protein [Burkholderia sp. Ap-962]NIF88916.1 AbrB/MazE/SpoVT f